MKSRPPVIMSIHLKLLILFHLFHLSSWKRNVPSRWNFDTYSHENRRPSVCKDELTSLALCRCLCNASPQSLVAPERTRLPPSCVAPLPASANHVKAFSVCSRFITLWHQQSIGSLILSCHLKHSPAARCDTRSHGVIKL